MKLLHETPNFDLVQIEDKFGLHIKVISVAVMPYTVNSAGIVEKIGVLHEWNPFRGGSAEDSNYADTLITGRIQDSDEDAFQTAVRELWEEGGFDLRTEGSDRWTFLGNFQDSKDSDRIIPTFAVDVTGLESSAPETDGTPGEAKSALQMLDANAAVLSNELLLLGAFLRLFNIMYHKSFKNAK